MKQIPTRAELIDQLETANRKAPVTIFGQLLAIAVISALIDWGSVVTNPMVSLVGAAVMVGPWLNALIRLWTQNKKEIGQLKESTQFGDFNKHNLRSLFNDTLRKLGLPDQRLPVYITADKSLNAGALRLGLIGLLPRLNGVYLNRQVLHKLNALEVQDIMGHELGHYYRYYLIADRYREITMILGGLIGIWLAQITASIDTVGVLVLLGVSSVFGWASGYSWRKHGQAVEFLCDDLGSKVNGVVHSINGLMKIGADEELRFAIHAEMLRKRKEFSNLAAAEVIEAIEAATPYGHTSHQELLEAIQRELKARSNSSGFSLIGLIRFLWTGGEDEDDNETIDEFLKMADELAKRPRLDWESLLTNDGIAFDEQSAGRLVQMIEQNPGKLLFRLPNATQSIDGIHPPLPDRILFLWKNRNSKLETP